MRRVPILCTTVASLWLGCVSSLPDEPLTVPAGPVQGLLPSYLTDEEAHTISFGDTTDPRSLRPDETPVAFEDFFVTVDTLRGLFLGEVDGRAVFRPRSYLFVPGITFARRDDAGRLVFDNHTDRITGLLTRANGFELLLREPGVLPPPPNWPLTDDVRRANDLTRPSELVTETYFECFDERRGLIGGWTAGTIFTAPCLTRTGS